MKKAITLLLALLVTLGLAACGGGSDGPSAVVKEFLDGYKAGDTERVSAVYAGESLGDAVPTDMDSSDASDQAVLEKLLDFEYEIGEEKIDGDKATVEVTIHAYPLGEAFKAYMQQAFSAILSGGDEDQADELLQKELDKLDERSYSSTATLDLEKQDDAWKVSPIDENTDLIDALTGGLLKELSDAFSGLSDAA